jgi:ketosteroid isomerase-like protein
MKADAQTEAEVMVALNRAMEAYAGRDMEGLLACIAPDPDVVQFGMSAVNAKRIGREGLRAEFESDWSASEAASCEIGWRSVSAAGSVAWVVADITLHWKEADQPEEAVPARLTAIFEKRGGQWLWMHSHFSQPIGGPAETPS